MNLFSQQLIRLASVVSLSFCTVAMVQAAPQTKFEITPFVGQMFSSDLQEATGNDKISVDSGTNFGIGFAWQDSPKGQGQILVNAVSHNFSNANDDGSHKLNIVYAHFNGIAQFRQQAYVTTISLGLGGAYFDAEEATDLAPSATAAIGTRYEFSNNLALVTELRSYASLVDEEENVFCDNDVCSAKFDGSIWLETSLSVGIAYSF